MGLSRFVTVESLYLTRSSAEGSLARSRHSKGLKRHPLKVEWASGSRTVPWDALWARLLSNALTSLSQSSGVEEATVPADEGNDAARDIEGTSENRADRLPTKNT